MGGSFEASVGTEALAGHLPGHQDNTQPEAWSEASQYLNMPRASGYTQSGFLGPWGDECHCPSLQALVSQKF